MEAFPDLVVELDNQDLSHWTDSLIFVETLIVFGVFLSNQLLVGEIQ